MPDRLTEPTTEPAPEPAAADVGGPIGRRTPWVRVLVEMVVVVAVFAAAGALCGLLWFKIWSPPPGVVAGNQWYPDPIEAGLRADFSGTGLYVAIAVLAGLVLGAVTAYFFDRSELATLVAVVLGAALAGWLMLQVGTELSPPDPDLLAKTSEEGIELDGHLYVGSSTDDSATVKRPALLCYPTGALVGLSAVYLLTRSRRTDNP